MDYNQIPTNPKSVLQTNILERFLSSEELQNLADRYAAAKQKKPNWQFVLNDADRVVIQQMLRGTITYIEGSEILLERHQWKNRNQLHNFLGLAMRELYKQQ